MSYDNDLYASWERYVDAQERAELAELAEDVLIWVRSLGYPCHQIDVSSKIQFYPMDEKDLVMKYSEEIGEAWATNTSPLEAEIVYNDDGELDIMQSGANVIAAILGYPPFRDFVLKLSRKMTILDIGEDGKVIPPAEKGENNGD